MITIRPFRTDDAAPLLSLCRETIRTVNLRDYTPEQVRAWAPDAIDLDPWSARFLGRFVPVAEEDGRPVGFAELEDDGHIDRFYVAADRQRRGIGAALMGCLEGEARRRGMARLTVEASITARPFFEARGFRLLATQVVPCRGVEFVNHRMERAMADDGSSLVPRGGVG